MIVTQAFAEVLNGSRWMIDPTAMVSLLTRALATTPQEVEAARVEAASMDRLASPTVVGDTAMIAMQGPIVYKANWFSMLFGCASIEIMRHQFRVAMADSTVRTILFRCDSPGGVVDFVPEFGDEIYAARQSGRKPILFAADPVIGSAAYWLAAQGNAIYASRSSMIGSIGTYIEHHDISAMLEKMGIKITLVAHPAAKVLGNQYEPMSEAALADRQAFVDEVGLEFEAAVMRGRNASKQKVLGWTQLGIPPRGKRAIELGLADKAGSFDELMAKLTNVHAPRVRADGELTMVLAESGVPEVKAADVSAEPAAPVEGETTAEAPFAPAAEAVDAQRQADLDALQLAQAVAEA